MYPAGVRISKRYDLQSKRYFIECGLGECLSVNQRPRNNWQKKDFHSKKTRLSWKNWRSIIDILSIWRNTKYIRVMYSCTHDKSTSSKIDYGIVILLKILGRITTLRLLMNALSISPKRPTKFDEGYTALYF